MGPKRLPKIANVEEAAIDQQDIYINNQTSSPLLALPLEVRLLIFEGILINKHIHIQSDGPGRASAWLFPESAELSDCFPFGKSKRQFDASEAPVAKSIKLGDTNEPAIWLTPIWRSCRQLYHEIIPMIYSDSNVISFEDAGDTGELIVRFNGQLQKFTKFWLYRSTLEKWLFFGVDRRGNLNKRPKGLLNRATEIRVPCYTSSLRRKALTVADPAEAWMIEQRADQAETSRKNLQREFRPFNVVAVQVNHEL